MKRWEVNDVSRAKYLGMIEVQLPLKKRGAVVLESACERFEVLKLPKRLVFGGACNVGFLESGYIEREEHESVDETLQELVEDLEVYYRDGKKYTSRIVCNGRM